MASTRRIFLEIVGTGAAVTGLNLSCVAIVTPAGPEGTGGATPVLQGTGGTGTGGAAITGGGQGSGGAAPSSGGTGGQGATGPGPQGTGGSNGTGGSSGTGGAAQQDAGSGAGTGGARVDAGAGDAARVDAGAADGLARDAGPPTLLPGDVLAGNISSLPVGALNAVSGRTFAIGRDTTGVYALTLVCTHQGCTAAPAGATGARQVNCPCHGSQFDRNGAVIQGPATRPLVHFGVTIDASGNIVVHSTTQVAANVRVTV